MRVRLSLRFEKFAMLLMSNCTQPRTVSLGWLDILPLVVNKHMAAPLNKCRSEPKALSKYAVENYITNAAVMIQKKPGPGQMAAQIQLQQLPPTPRTAPSSLGQNNEKIYDHPLSLLALFPWETTRPSLL